MTYEQMYKNIYKVVSQFPLKNDTKETRDAILAALEEGVGGVQLKESCAHTATSFILSLGTLGTLQAMVKARDFMILPNERGGITFKFSGNTEYNRVDIVCNWLDLVNIRVYKEHGGKVVRETTSENVYIEQLKPTLERMMNLYLTL